MKVSPPSSRVDGPSHDWAAFSSTTSTGRLPDTCRPDSTRTLVGSHVASFRIVVGSHGRDALPTDVDTHLIVWSDGTAGTASAQDNVLAAWAEKSKAAKAAGRELPVR
jgi:hypothetical protein